MKDTNPRIPGFIVLQRAKLFNLKFHFFIMDYCKPGTI
jgi:hypothetical protein